MALLPSPSGFSFPRPLARARGLSMTELLVAMTIALVFASSIVLAFVQVSRSADEADVQLRGHSRARAALDTMARDLAQVAQDPSLPGPQVFTLSSLTQTVGDNIDNDGDGVTDEEVFDGLDNDCDWTLAEDRHAFIGGRQERPQYVGIADLGDDRVDKDTLFSADALTIRIPADPMGVGLPQAREIRYSIGSFDGNDWVLLREERVETAPGVFGLPEIEPLVFDVVSLDILAWNANASVETAISEPCAAPGNTYAPYWQETFDSTLAAAEGPFDPSCLLTNGCTPTPGTGFDFPAAVLLHVTVSAERLPLAEIKDWPTGGRELKTVSLTTVVALDPTIRNGTYFTEIRPTPFGGATPTPAGTAFPTATPIPTATSVGPTPTSVFGTPLATPLI